MAHELPSQLMNSCNGGFLICFIEWANNVTGGLFSLMILLGFCVILFMATARLGNARAFGYSTFVGLIGSIWLVIMGLMSWYYASAFIIAGGIGIVVLILNEN